MRENFVGFQYLHKENNNSKANLQHAPLEQSEFSYFSLLLVEQEGLAAAAEQTHIQRAQAEIEFLHVFLFSVNAAKLFRLRCWLLLRSSRGKNVNTLIRTPAGIAMGSPFFQRTTAAFQINTNRRIKKFACSPIVSVANSFATFLFHCIPEPIERASRWSLEKKLLVHICSETTFRNRR